LKRTFLFSLPVFVFAAVVLWAAPPEGALVNSRREILVMSNGKHARLRNQPQARDRTLGEVLRFVSANTANRVRYAAGRHVCTEYAVALHDAAEANGLRCGLVSVTFTAGVGHAMNVFQTTDHGLIYIDCTGGPEGDPEDDFDTIGFLEIGKPYGRLNVELGARAPSRYAFYENAMSVFRNLKAWDRELSRELASIQAAQAELEGIGQRANREEAAALSARFAALQSRVTLYNNRVTYRNDLARTFRVQFQENKAPVARADVFW
jgi:hypothetical protein